MAVLVVCSHCLRADDGDQPAPVPTIDPNAPVPWDSSSKGSFMTCLCMDRTGKLWFGGEDYGVSSYDPATGKWYQACAPSTLSDTMVYSLACDWQGRIWAGTSSHGVAVYNGRTWGYYGEIEGLCGSHVFAIAVSPLNGDVFMATEAGITRYSDKSKSWTFFPTSVNGAHVEPTCLAFDKNGRLFAGTQCDGILSSSPGDDYRSWQVTNGLEALPVTPQGQGLPSGDINCILVTQDGSIWAGTSGGLAVSKDDGESWSYYCGADWPDKQAGLANAAPDAETTAAAAMTTEKFTMREDYVTSLAEFPAGYLWIGHRRHSFDRLNIAAMTLDTISDGDKWGSAFAEAMLPNRGRMLMATYGGGLKSVAFAPPSAAASAQTPAAVGGLVMSTSSTLPGCATDSEAEMPDMLTSLREMTASPDEYKPFVTPLPDDWVTRGDWLGRYRGYWAVLAAAVSPYDYVWGASPFGIDYDARIGPHCFSGDSLRYWVHWLYSDDPRVLEMPATYLQSRIKRGLATEGMNRRQSEWDDHGEVEPEDWDGASLFFTLAVPTGLFRLSLYEFNKDGHTDYNVYRNYRISIREHPEDVPLDDVDSFAAMPEMAHGRIDRFWGGVWKRFAVRGPIDLTIELNRNYSTNTILPCVMLDLLDDTPPAVLRDV